MWNIEDQRKSYRDLYARSSSRREDIKQSRRRRILRKRHIVNAYKIFFGCIDCGYRENPVALDLDHREPKEKEREMAALIHSSAPLLDLFNEAFKCDVRCANCHRIRHQKDFEKSTRGGHQHD